MGMKRIAVLCKRMVKKVQCRLKLLRNKRYAIVRHLRGDVAQLIRMGDRNRALSRLLRDENLMAVYELLDHFSEFIIIHMPYIRRHRELPNDINEAVSSLVFASSRCGDIPELCSIRQLFGQRYGQRFLATALHLLPDNLVNCQIKEKLCVVSVPDDVKSKLVDEIAREYCLGLEVLALEYTAGFHKQVKESKSAEIERKEIMSCSAGFSVEKPFPCQEQHAEVDAYDEAEVYKFTITELDIEKGGEVGRRGNRGRDDTEIATIYPEYNIEELKAKDQRMFRFVERVRDIHEKSLDEVSQSEKPGSISGGKSRRSRRRSRSWETVMKNDMASVVYYRRHGCKRHQKQVKPYNVSTCPNKQHSTSNGSNSCGIMVPKHVHPKLPDYDEIAAKFMALRRDNMYPY
ncbi:PREDICTED: uncharacterized protein LOC104814485 isoform X2 [Tarenaya hassleriana]|uniref:uncharacterized protein LOC104814485 isoform X2 n=1 Tax=Tarenaya hassleriana TaxID=28532 RepID=UPI00053C82C0|nr:PREDICTED: uncharacterized protein LOC104814485 isoform X2 [Tarenaya hassleriana]